jgi:dTDP-4-amino-4,6-dideoxygalactose transaminase|tara:strand:+ start:1941 stop:2873 length:933 start_codon:yes stop_codon:yes gene_type:complete
MIQLFNLDHHIIDTSEFNHYLHADVVSDLEKQIAEYVGAKYACSVNSATSAIFLSFVNKNVVPNLPSVLPPVVVNAIITSGNEFKFIDDTEWVGDSYVLHQFKDYKIVDSAQKLEPNQFKKECEPNDLMIFSHYPTKPLGGADGGMIVTDDYNKYKWFKEAVLNGMTYADNNWERGISFPGYKMYMSSIQAKIIQNNFKNFEEKMSYLDYIVDTYNKELGYSNSSKHLYRIETTDNVSFIKKMKDVGITCGIHYDALHLNSVYSKLNLAKRYRTYKESERIKDRTVSLPMNETMSMVDLEYVIDKVKSFL